MFTPSEDGRILVSIPSTDRARILPLVRWLGPGAELLGPQDLRQELASELADLAALYAANAKLERSA
ncbi:WYL domain-containing protein [Roseibium salinum]|nr:WYL domain-containing protein [Roseibium salinum]